MIDGSDEENREPEEQPETRIEVEIPRINTDLGKALHYVKLPNFLSVETRYTVISFFPLPYYIPKYKVYWGHDVGQSVFKFCQHNHL